MFNALTRRILSIFVLLALLGCSDGFDRNTNLDRSDIREVFFGENKSASTKKTEAAEGFVENENEDVASVDVPLPQISSMLTFPEPPQFSQGNQIISFSVTDDIDLKDVLIELGRVTNLDVDIDPKISGGVIVNAKNRPLIEIIDRISRLGNLRYSFADGVLTFKSDTAFTKHYLVDYLIDGPLWDEVTSNMSSILANLPGEENPTISANKSAGIITVYANNAGQEAVDSYLEQVKKSASAQVLIEAKVVEVTLNDKYTAGIDWTFLDGTTDIKNQPSANATDPFTAAIAGSGVLGGDVTLSLRALEEFGNVRAISSPRISALNNRKATLDFVNTLVYFTIETESNTTNSTVSTTTNTITATINEEPIGVELEITPSIDVSQESISLEVRPKLSVQSDTVEDPSVDSSGNPLGNEIPVIQTREIQTSMKIKSGETLVIGGLMQEDTSNTDQGIPYLSRIPLIGSLFKYVSKTTKVVETVIFIKATIVDSAAGVNKYDREIHNKFTATKRPYF